MSSTIDNEMTEALVLDGMILSYSALGLAAMVTEFTRYGVPTDEVEAHFGPARAALIGVVKGWVRRVNDCGGKAILPEGSEACALYEGATEDPAPVEDVDLEPISWKAADHEPPAEAS